MVERLKEYRKKCNVLKQIQSDKALFYRHLNAVQNFSTVFVATFITFIGFSGTAKINGYVNFMFSIANDDLTIVEMMYNGLVFILFLCIIFHLVFQFTSKQAASENAVSLLSVLINEIDDIIEKTSSSEAIDIVRYKYATISSIIPPNTDREYLKAKKRLGKKEKISNSIENHNIYVLPRKKQEEYLSSLISNNESIKNIIDVLKGQGSEFYLGGGVIRNIVWDSLHGYSTMTPIDDIDVIYLDREHSVKSYDIAIEKKLINAIPNYRWSVKNQARMHEINGDSPYIDLHDAVSKWPETASAILVRGVDDGTYEFIAPYGFDDLFRLIVHPTPYFMEKLDRYKERICSRRWAEKWGKLKFFHLE